MGSLRQLPPRVARTPRNAAAALVLLVSLIASSLPHCSAHVVFISPVPRSASSALKLGPCGGYGSVTDDSYKRATISPGPYEVHFVETLAHRGAPFRVALSQEGDESTFSDCILLDHIPHDDYGTQNGEFRFTVQIPNVTCTACSLQLLQVMTDKIPPGETCTYDPECTSCTYYRESETERACHSNYHSCANVRIVGGAEPRSQYQCAQPAEAFLHPSLAWCEKELYSQESAEWSENGEVLSFYSQCQNVSKTVAPKSSAAITRGPRLFWVAIASLVIYGELRFTSGL